MNELKAKRQAMRDESKKYGPTLREIPCNGPMHRAFPTQAPVRAWRSRDFLVQLYVDRHSGCQRLSVNRTELNSDGGWKDGITWDDLQRLKREAGFGNMWALEVYRADDDLVYDANIRHLFLFAERPAFAWTRENAASTIR